MLYEWITKKRLPDDIHTSTAYNTWRISHWLRIILGTILLFLGTCAVMISIMIKAPEKLSMDYAVFLVFFLPAIYIIMDIGDTAILTYKKFGEPIAKENDKHVA